MQRENKTMEERFDEMKKGFFAVKQNEWWSSDEDYIKSFIQSEIDIAKAEERRAVVESVTNEFDKQQAESPFEKMVVGKEWIVTTLTKDNQ